MDMKITLIENTAVKEPDHLKKIFCRKRYLNIFSKVFYRTVLLFLERDLELKIKVKKNLYLYYGKMTFT